MAHSPPGTGRMINIRMKRPTPSSRQSSADDRTNLPDILRVMRRQEESAYRCENYIGRRSRERLDSEERGRGHGHDGSEVGQKERTSGDGADAAEADEIDVSCREKMCDWSYRIVDHFEGNREIVAISFSYLDRFLDRCSCDRTAFKLAAITSLYVAMKIFSHKRVSMSSLAELSRGEFDSEHIAEMERIILQTLSWRMHPPTTRGFISNFLGLLDLPPGDPINVTVSQRANFFGELAVFDYFFVTESPSVIAYASVLNALEGLCPSHISERAVRGFHLGVERSARIYYERFSMETIRARLWQLYRQSEQFKIEGSASLIPERTECSGRLLDTGDDGDKSLRSPVYVGDHFRSAEMC